MKQTVSDDLWGSFEHHVSTCTECEVGKLCKTGNMLYDDWWDWNQPPRNSEVPPEPEELYDGEE